MTDEKPDLAELAHHGIKGMKWGVRRGSIRDRARGAVDDSFQRRIVSANAIATGNAKGRDRWRSATTTPTGLIPSKKIAARRERILKDRRKRFSEGKATVGDVLSAVGHTRIKDMFLSRRDKRGADVADVKNVKQFSAHEARRAAGSEFANAKKNADLMSTKLSEAHANGTLRGDVVSGTKNIGVQTARGASTVAKNTATRTKQAVGSK